MAKSIIDIDVNDEQFKRFLELFADYKEALGKLPDEWKGAETATAAAGVPVEAMTAALLAQVGLIQEQITAVKAAEKVQKDADDAKRKADQEERERLKERQRDEKALTDQEKKAAAERSEKQKARQKSLSEAMERTKTFWKDTEAATANVARNTLSIAKDVAEFSIKGVAFGLVGSGAGLYGLDALANVVGNQRREAQGLGVPTSESQAFEVNFGRRLVGSDFLQNIQGVQTDITRQWQFGMLGIGDQEVQNGDPATLGIDVIKAANRLWQQNPNAHNQAFMNANGLGGMMSFQDWRRIGQYSPQDLAKLEGQYQTDAKTMGADDQTQKDWQDFAAQLDRAGKQIQKIFVDDLKPLTGPLSDLSKSLVDVAKGLLSNPHMKEWIDDLSSGLESLSKYLHSDQFNADLHTFVDDIGWIAHKLGALMSWMSGSLPGANPATPGSAPALPAERWDSNAPGLPTIGGYLAHALAPLRSDNSKTWDFSGVSKFYGLPASLWHATGMVESGLNPATKDSVVNGVHYQGMWQMGPAMQAQYGVKDPMNPDQEANAFGRAMDDYLNYYGGDLKKALAAYNWGPGNLQKDIAAHGDDWLDYAPAETQNYIKKVVGEVGTDTIKPDLPGAQGQGSGMGHESRQAAGNAPPLAHPGQVTITVMNQTGAQIGMIANGVRQ